MADAALLRLERMLPEVTYFVERQVFTEKEMKRIMDERRVLEMAIHSRATCLKDYMSYIKHEIQVECDRRERFAQLKIQRSTPRDFTIVKRIHSLFRLCLGKYSSDLSVWNQYIEFCTASGCNQALSRVIMMAIKRHPRVASFRVIAADRELQQGTLVSARKLLMRAIRIKTDNRLMIWSQLFKLECSAIHKLVSSERVPDGPAPSCKAATVVYRHALADLPEVGKVSNFITFAKEAFEALEIAILGFPEPADLQEFRETIRH